MKPNQPQKKVKNDPIEIKRSIIDAIVKQKMKKVDDKPQTYSKIQDLLNQKKMEYRQDRESKRMGDNINNLKAIVDSIFKKNKPKTDNFTDAVREKLEFIDKLKKENSSLKAQLENLHNTVSETQVQKKQQEEINAINQDKIRALEQNSKREEREMAYEKNLKELEVYLKEKDKIIEQKDEQIKNNAISMKKLENDLFGVNDNSKKQEDSLKLKLMESNSHNTKQKELIRLLQKKNHEFENQILDLTRKLNQKEHAISKFLSQNKSESEGNKIFSDFKSESLKKPNMEEENDQNELLMKVKELDDVKAQLEQSKLQNEQLESLSSQLKKDLQELEKQKNDIQEENKKVEKLNEEYLQQAEENNDMLERFCEDIKELKEDNKKLMDQLNTNKNEINADETEIKDMTVELEQKNDEIAELKNRISQLTGGNDVLFRKRQSIDDIDEYEQIQEVANLNEGETNYKVTVRLLKQTQANLQKELEKTKDQLEHKMLELDKAQELIQNLQHEKEAVNSEVEADQEKKNIELNKLKSKLKFYIMECDKMSQPVVKEEETKEEAEEEAEVDFEKQRKKLSIYIEECNKLGKTVEQVKDDKKALQNKIDELQKIIDNLNLKEKEYKVKEDTMIEQIDQLRDNIKKLKEVQLKKADEDDMENKEELAQLQEEIDSKNKQIDELQNINDDLQNRLESEREQEFMTDFKQKNPDSQNSKELSDLMESFENDLTSKPELVEVVKAKVLEMDNYINSLTQELEANAELMDKLKEDNELNQNLEETLGELFETIRKQPSYQVFRPDEFKREIESYSIEEIFNNIKDYNMYLNKELDRIRDLEKKSERKASNMHEKMKKVKEQLEEKLSNKNENTIEMTEELHKLLLDNEISYKNPYNALKAKLDELEQNREKLKIALEDKAIHEKEAKESSNQLVISERGYDHLRKKYDKLQDLLKKNKKENPLKDDVERLEDKVRELEKLEFENQDLHKKLEASNIKLKNAHVETKRLRKESQAMTETNQSYLRDLTELKGQLAEKTLEINKIKSSRKNTEKQLETLSIQLKEKNEELNRKSSQIKNKKKEYKKMKEMYKSKDKLVSELESALSRRQSDAHSQYKMEFMSHHDIDKSVNSNTGKKQKPFDNPLYKSLQPGELKSKFNGDGEEDEDSEQKVQILYSKQFMGEEED